MSEPSAELLGALFEGCPEPLAILQGEVITSHNAAFRARFGEVEALPDPGAGRRWTRWSAGPGAVCARLDGPAAPMPEIPAPLAPLFADGEPVPLRTLLLGKLFERLDAVFWSIAADGTILLSDGSGLARLGLRPHQSVGLNAFQLYPPGSLAREETAKVLGGEQIRSDMINGREYWSSAMEPVRDASGQVTAMLGFTTCTEDGAAGMLQAKALLAAIEELPVAIWAMELDGICSLSVGKGLRDLGIEPSALLGVNLFELYANRPEFRANVERALAGEQFVTEVMMGDQLWRSHYLPARDAFGDRVQRVYGVAENVTERNRNERRLKDQLALIEAQREAITALTSPIIEVWEGILVVPLIGTLDSGRAGELQSRLLDRVVDRQSRAVILDLTGVEVVDTGTAQHLFQILRGVDLLGATGVVSGIRPSVARTMTELGIDVASRRTHRTVAEALRGILAARRSAGAR